MSDGETLEALARTLRLATGSSRVTIRICIGDQFPVAAESCGERVASLRDVQIDPRGSATFEFLSVQRRVLIQDDIRTHELAPPPEVVATYGIRSQMVAPVIVRGELGALISVHDVTGARIWTGAEQEALERAAAEVASRLS